MRRVDRSTQELISSLHTHYNESTHPGAGSDSLESHITRRLADVEFLTSAEAAKLHEEYHRRTGAGGKLAQHPTVSLYWDTESTQLPLMLVIGQEPNDTLAMADFVWTYNFDDPKAQFWSAAYKMFAKVNGLGLDEFRAKCRAWRGSPIAFADASPLPLKAKVGRKAAARAEIALQAFREHVDQIFSMQTHNGSLKDRLGLVVMSGLKNRVFEPSVERVVEHCRNPGKNIPYIGTRFLRWTFYDEIMAELDPKARSSMKRIFVKWDRHFPKG